jgi:5-methylcytosine-specific restriction endonuclease McrA
LADSINLHDFFDSMSARSLLNKLRENGDTGYSEEELAEQRAKEQERSLNQKRRCNKCNAVFIRRDMQWLHIPGHSKLYCVDCFPKVKKRYTFTCHSCDVEFLARQQRTLCDQCRIYNRKAQRKVIKRHKDKSTQAGLPATLEVYEWIFTLKYFDGKCAYCQEQPYQELDHFVPPEAGGGTTAKNCVPACYACNHDKSNFDPTYLPVHTGTNYIDEISVSILWPNMHVSLRDIKRVAAYLVRYLI